MLIMWKTYLVANRHVGVVRLARVKLSFVLHRLETLGCALLRLYGDVGITDGSLWRNGEYLRPGSHG